MKKKLFKVVALLLAAAMLLSACGGGGDTTTKAPGNDTTVGAGDETTPAAGDNTEDALVALAEAADRADTMDLYPAYDLGGVTLTVLEHNDIAQKNPDAPDIEDYEKADRQALKDYIEAKYNVKLEFVPIPTDDYDNIPTEIASAYAAGHPTADIMDAYYNFMLTYMSNDMLYDPTEEFNSTDLFSDKATFKWMGGQLGLTSGIGGEGLYYNADMIAEAGMEYTPAEMFDMGMWDYDNFHDYLVQLKAGLGADDYPFFVDPLYWMLYATSANGIQILDDNNNLNYKNENFLESMQFLVDLINEGLCAVAPQDEEGNYDTWGYPSETFGAGNTIAITHRAAWQASGDAGNFTLGFVPYPYGSNVTVSNVGESGAYKTMSDNVSTAYFDGQVICLTKGVEEKADPLGIQVMMCEWLGWNHLLNGFTKERTASDCSWLEAGSLDQQLYFWSLDHESLERYNFLRSGSVFMNGMSGATRMGIFYEGLDLRGTFESAYNADMQNMIDLGYATPDVMN